MKKAVAAAVLMVFTISLAGCAGPGQEGINKQTGGAVLGGIGGGVIGSRIGSGRGAVIATIAGAIIGGLLGSEVGKQLDERDRLVMARETQTTLEQVPSGRTSTWSNPDTGARGTITPKPAYQTSTGQYCREFQQTITVGGKTEQAYGTACRQPDGSWKIVQ